MDSSGLEVTLNAKQGQQRGGHQGGTTHLESPLVSATPKSEVICISPHQKQSAFMPLLVLLLLFKAKNVVSEAICVSAKASLGERVTWLSPARPCHGTQLHTQLLQLVLPGAGWTHSTLKHNQVLTRSLSKFWQLLSFFHPRPQLDSLHRFF